MPTTPRAATAFSARPCKKRTLVRGRLAAFVVAAAIIAAPVVAPVSPVGAVQVSERASQWIAVTSREVALELRAVRDLSESETRHVAGRKIAELAAFIAYLLDADAEALRGVWFNTPVQRKIAMFSALSQVGVPYKLNADAPFIALDCSSLTMFAWAQAGVEIERGSAQQYARATRVSRDDVQAGDLVWYPGHIMMSLGVPELIVAARSGQRTVEVHRIDSTRLSWMRWVSPLG
ncbi:MAG: C40 family peptidase [Actinomycetota bacterium]